MWTQSSNQDKARIEFLDRIPFCICNRCGRKICDVKYDISMAKFINELYTDLPIICQMCQSKEIRD